MSKPKPTQPTETQHPLYHLHQLLAQLVQRYRRPEPAHTTLALALAELLQPARHTIAQLWSLLGLPTFPARAYRLFQRLFDPQRAFRLLFEQCLAALPPNEPLLVILDATQVPRTGKRMPGVGLLRASNTVPFAKGLHRAQRWSAAFVLTPAEHGYRRAICVRFEPAFTPKSTPAPAGCQASEAERGWAIVRQLRAWMDAAGRQGQLLVVLADGTYSTRAFVQGLPPRTMAIVRLRADARLTTLPDGGGRRRVYGESFAPRDLWRAQRASAVPERLRAFWKQGWRSVLVEVRGRERARSVWFGLCRRRDWGRQVFGCLIIRGRRGVGRAKEQAPMAFLVASGDGAVSSLPCGLAEVAEWVWQRWECEVSFREMKSGFGLGEKGCWGPRSGVVNVQWSAWLFGACVWSGWRAWGVCGGERYRRGWYGGVGRWSYRALWGALYRGLVEGKWLEDWVRLGLWGGVDWREAALGWGERYRL